jgi:DNA-binding PadR family transcriptional regulator
MTRYIEYYRVMLTYDVLAALWNAPATDVGVTRAVEDRLGTQLSRNFIDQHLRVLRTTGYVKTRNIGGEPAYVLTDAGSQLLAQLAAQIEREEYI